MFKWLYLWVVGRWIIGILFCLSASSIYVQQTPIICIIKVKFKNLTKANQNASDLWSPAVAHPPQGALLAQALCPSCFLEILTMSSGSPVGNRTGSMFWGQTADPPAAWKHSSGVPWAPRLCSFLIPDGTNSMEANWPLRACPRLSKDGACPRSQRAVAGFPPQPFYHHHQGHRGHRGHTMTKMRQSCRDWGPFP